MRNKYNQIADSLKDVTEGYEEKIKEYNQQIKKLEAENQTQTTDILGLQQEIEDNKKAGNTSINELKDIQKKEMQELNSKITDLISQNHGLEEFGKMRETLTN